MCRLDTIPAAIPDQIVEAKVAEAVGDRPCKNLASLGEGDIRCLDAFYRRTEFGADAAADEACLPSFQSPVPDAGFGPEVGLEDLEPFRFRSFLHRRVIKFHRL